MLQNTTQRGQGVVEWAELHVDASYSFDVRGNGHRPHGHGQLTAKNSLDGALNRDGVRLCLETEERVAVRLTAGSATQWFFRLQALEEEPEPAPDQSV